MKFAIHTPRTVIDGVNVGWTVQIKGPAGDLTPARALDRCGEQGDGFPVPAEVLASWKGKAHEQLCEPPGGDPDPIRNVYEQIVVGEARRAEIEKFGRYLSAVLLGDNWPQLEAAAGKEGIELELHIAPDDVELNRLPWEMLYGADGPLAASRGRDVAVTRVVDSRHAAGGGELELPLRVLFVIGGRLDDKLRPGAEYVGLLRRMEIPLAGAVGKKSVELDTRPLLEATRLDLGKAVEEFRPDVVHFICHGVAGPGGGRIMLTKPSDAPGGPSGYEECNAQQLLFYMSNDGLNPEWLPRIVVLNACHTADTAGDAAAAPETAGTSIKGAYLSLAAQLVAGGVPVTIGMAGEIADAACRTFTHSFYEALLKNESVARATARARRAAMFYYEHFYTDSVEWVRPTIFAAEGALDELRTSKTRQAELLSLSEIGANFLSDQNLLCDRLPYLKEFDRFRQEVEAGGTRQVLAFRLSERESETEKFGKTRLLEEIAVIAVTNNFIPCLVRSSGAFEGSSDLLPLAVMLADAMNVTRTRFGLPERPLSNALSYVFRKLKIEADAGNRHEFDSARIEAEERMDELATPADKALMKRHATLAKGLILADFGQLAADINEAAARGAGEGAAPRVRRPMLLLDDLHLYEGVTSLLLDEVMIGPHGLGDAKLPVPVVFTYSAFVDTDPRALSDIDAFVARGKYVAKTDLLRFDPPHETRLAYSQYLLSRKQPLTVNWVSAKRTYVEVFFKHLHRHVSGVPLKLYNNTLAEAIISFATEEETLLDATADLMLSKLDEVDRAAALKG